MKTSVHVEFGDRAGAKWMVRVVRRLMDDLDEVVTPLVPSIVQAFKDGKISLGAQPPPPAGAVAADFAPPPPAPPPPYAPDEAIANWERAHGQSWRVWMGQRNPRPDSGATDAAIAAWHRAWETKDLDVPPTTPPAPAAAP